MMSNRSKSSGVVVKVSVITEGDARVHVQCDELKDCQDMRITEGDFKCVVQSGLEDCPDMRIADGNLKCNIQPTGLTDCLNIRTMKSSNSISVMLSTLLAVVISVGIKVAFPEVDPQMIGGMSMIGFSVSLMVQQWFHSRSFTLSTLLAVVIIVGMKITYPEVDLLMTGIIAMIGFCVSLFVQQWSKPQCLSVLEFPNQEINCPVTEEPVCPRDENITEEEINSCPGEIIGTESTTASTPVKLIEVRKNNGEVILYKCKTETLKEAEELAAKQYEEEMALKKTDETQCHPITIREVKRSHALKLILEGKPDCPGDEEPTLVSTDEKPVCPGDEETIIVCEEKEKRWSPLKKSLKVIEKRSEQQIAEYGPPEEQNPTCKVVEEPICPRDEKITYEEVPPIKIREYKRSHASQIILEDKPVCPGDEDTTILGTESTTASTPIKLMEIKTNNGEATFYKCKSETLEEAEELAAKQYEEEMALKKTDWTQHYPITIREVKRSHASQIILEDKPVCPGDEEPTLVCTDEKPVCPGDEKITFQEVNTPLPSPVILKEVTSNKGEVTIYKIKKQKKRWSPFKKSHKVIERRSQQQIAEYGPPEEQNPTCKVAEEPTCEVVEEPICKVDEVPTCEVVEEPICKVAEVPTCEVAEEPTCKEIDEPTKVCEDLQRTKTQLRVSLNAKSLIFSTLLAVIIFVGVKVAFPEVDLQMISGMSTIGFLVSLLVHQLFISNNSECCHCHVLSGEECTCHTLFGIYFGLLI